MKQKDLVLFSHVLDLIVLGRMFEDTLARRAFISLKTKTSFFTGSGFAYSAVAILSMQKLSVNEIHSGEIAISKSGKF